MFTVGISYQSVLSYFWSPARRPHVPGPSFLPSTLPSFRPICRVFEGVFVTPKSFWESGLDFGWCREDGLGPGRLDSGLAQPFMPFLGLWEGLSSSLGLSFCFCNVRGCVRVSHKSPSSFIIFRFRGRAGNSRIWDTVPNLGSRRRNGCCPSDLLASFFPFSFIPVSFLSFFHLSFHHPSSLYVHPSFSPHFLLSFFLFFFLFFWDVLIDQDEDLTLWT